MELRLRRNNLSRSSEPSQSFQLWFMVIVFILAFQCRLIFAHSYQLKVKAKHWRVGPVLSLFNTSVPKALAEGGGGGGGAGGGGGECQNCGSGGGGGSGGDAAGILFGIAAIIAPIAAAVAQVSAAKTQAKADMFIASTAANAAITQTKEVGKRTLEIALIGRQQNLDTLNRTVKLAKDREEAADQRFQIQAAVIERQEQRKFNQQELALAFQERQANQQIAAFKEQAAQTINLAQQTRNAQLVAQNLSIGDGGQGRLDVVSSGVPTSNGAVGAGGLGISSFGGGGGASLRSVRGAVGENGATVQRAGLDPSGSAESFSKAISQLVRPKAPIASNTTKTKQVASGFGTKIPSSKARISKPRTSNRLLSSLRSKVGAGRSLRLSKNTRGASDFARLGMRRGIAALSTTPTNLSVPPGLAAVMARGRGIREGSRKGNVVRIQSKRKSDLQSFVEVAGRERNRVEARAGRRGRGREARRPSVGGHHQKNLSLRKFR